MNIIKQNRERLDLSRRQLANRLGVHQQLVVRWENGQAPELKHLPIIYKEMGITYKQLVNNYKEL